MKKKHNHIKATIEVLGDKYYVEEYSKYNGDTRYLFRKVDGKGKTYAPRIDTVGNCLTAFTNIYKKTISSKDTTIGCDKNNVPSATELNYLNKEGFWANPEEPPKELDAFIIVFHTHLKRVAAKKIKKEMEKNEIKKEVPLKVEDVNLDAKVKIRNLTEELLNIADQKRVESLESFLTKELFLNYKKLYQGSLK